MPLAFSEFTEPEAAALMMIPIDRLNAATREEAIDLMEPLVERSRWVVEETVALRPFADRDALASALAQTIRAAGPEAQVALFNNHPELAGREAEENTMTPASTDEQARLGLLRLSSADAQRLRELNAAYRERFGFPFIIALHRVPDLGSLFATFERRLAAPPAVEHEATLAEIASVIRSRTVRLFAPSSINTAETPGVMS